MHTFKKKQRLKSRKTISELFAKGKPLSAFPIKLFWVATENDIPQPIQFGFSVPKRKFKLAVDRNKIKRRMLESVRLNKHILTHSDGTTYTNLALMFLYIGDQKADFKTIESKVIHCLKQLKEKKIWGFLTNLFLQ